MAAWLVKQEPGTYAFAQLVEDGRTTWDGVRNAQARNNIAAMERGDAVLYYHTGDEKAVVGLARVAKAPFPDPTDPESRWLAVDIVPVRPLQIPVTLARMRADEALQGFLLLRHSRLSVVPVSGPELARILRLGGPAR